MSTHRVLAGMLLALFACTGFAQGTTVIKEAKKNPGLQIASFTGPDEVRKQLINDITYSDWFTLTNDPAELKLSLAVVYAVNGREASLEMRLSDVTTKAELHAFRQRGPADKMRQLVHAAVDTLQTTYFPGTTGFCSTELLYVKEMPNGAKEVIRADFDGSHPSPVTRNGRLSTEPSWGPANNTMAYTLYGARSTWVMIMNMHDGSQRVVSRHPGLNAGGAISPDGRSMAILLSKDGQVDLYVLDLSTDRLKRLTNNASNEASPTWSPDGRTICFVSDHASRQPTLYTISPRGGTPKALLKLRVEAVSPDYSPDGQRITFATRVGSEYHIAVYPGTKGGEFDVITSAGGDWEGPSWAADSRHIVCSRNAGGSRALFLVDSLNYTTRQLHKFKGNDTLPDYSEARR